MFPSPLPRPCMTPHLQIDLCRIGDVRGSNLLWQSLFQQRPNSINRSPMNFQSLSVELHRVAKLTGPVRTSKVFYLQPPAIFSHKALSESRTVRWPSHVVTHDVIQTPLSAVETKVDGAKATCDQSAVANAAGNSKDRNRPKH